MEFACLKYNQDFTKNMSTIYIGQKGNYKPHPVICILFTNAIFALIKNTSFPTTESTCTITRMLHKLVNIGRVQL